MDAKGTKAIGKKNSRLQKEQCQGLQDGVQGFRSPAQGLGPGIGRDHC